jgi:hypothetical protein
MLLRPLHFNRRLAAGIAGVAVIALTGCSTPFPKNHSDVVTNLHDPDYPTQAFELSMAALKGFRGDIHYVGSDARFDYFRVGRERGFYRMVRRGSTLSGHRRFEVGSEAPFRVESEVIPYPPSQSTQAEQAAP